MDQVKQITAGGMQYNLAQASAVTQKKLLLIVGAKVAMNSAVSSKPEIDKELLKGALLTMPEASFDTISSIVLYKCFAMNSDTPVTIEDFQGNMNAYLDLIVEGVAANLDDFFIWLEGVNKRATSDKNPQTEKKQELTGS